MVRGSKEEYVRLITYYVEKCNDLDLLNIIYDFLRFSD